MAKACPLPSAVSKLAPPMLHFIPSTHPFSHAWNFTYPVCSTPLRTYTVIEQQRKKSHNKGKKQQEPTDAQTPGYGREALHCSSESTSARQEEGSGSASRDSHPSARDCRITRGERTAYLATVVEYIGFCLVLEGCNEGRYKRTASLSNACCRREMSSLYVAVIL